MRSYITYLLKDIKKAHRPSTSPDFPEIAVSFEEEMEEVEKWVTGTNIPSSLGLQCGLSFEQFPPHDQLAQEEVEAIMVAFHEMLSTWNMQVDFPDCLPHSRAYPLLINILKEEGWYLPGGTLHFDFCTGYAPECELKEYCPCLKYWNSETI